MREAAERGEFSGVPGEGRPLPRDPDEGLGDRWAAAHLLRSANASPEWVDLRREIHDARSALLRRVRAHRRWLRARATSVNALPAERILEAVRATEDADRRFAADVAAGLAELNAKIARYNLIVRAQLLPILPLTSERLFQLAASEE